MILSFSLLQVNQKKQKKNKENKKLTISNLNNILLTSSIYYDILVMIIDGAGSRKGKPHAAKHWRAPAEIV